MYTQLLLWVGFAEMMYGLQLLLRNELEQKITLTPNLLTLTLTKTVNPKPSRWRKNRENEDCSGRGRST